MSTILGIKVLLVLVVLALALYYDLRQHKIKNFITLPAAVAGCALNLWDQGWLGLVAALQGWLVPVLLLILLYFINVMGAGDIKLFAAIGAIMGLPFALESFAYTVFIGSAIALVLLIRKKEFLGRMAGLSRYIKLTMLSGKLVPYGQKGDTSSKFAFTIAIVPGTLVQLVLYYQNL